MKKYIYIFKTTIQTYLEYRAEIATKLLLTLVGLGINLFLWQTVIDENNTVGKYNFPAISAYYLLISIFSSIQSKSVAKHLEKFVRDGFLSTFLLEPSSVFLNLLFREVAQILFQFAITIVIFSSPFLLFQGIRERLIISPFTVGLVVLYIILTISFNFVFNFFLGCWSFWVVKSSGIRNVIMQTIGILRGSWFPLDLAPMIFQKVVSFLPFYYVAFHPVKILTSSTTGYENFRGIILLIAYIAVFGLSSAVVWKKGLKIYSAVGI